MFAETFDEKFLTSFLQMISDVKLLPQEEKSLDLLATFGNIRHELPHSNIIYRLLDPKFLPHSQSYGDLFLSMIGDITGNDINGEPIREIKREKPTKNHRYIDINIVTDNFDIIIENKVDSGDQDNQLIDYLEFIEKEFPEKTAILIYLTLSGYEPSEISISKEKIEELKNENRFGVLSYEKNIIDWLEKLPAEGILRSEIDIYKETIKEICGMNNINDAIKFGRQNFQKMKEFYVSNPKESSVCTDGINYIRTTATYLEFLRITVEDLRKKLEYKVNFFVAQSEIFTEYSSFEKSVLMSDDPFGIGVDINGEYRIGLEFNPVSNLIDGSWYFGYMKGVKGTPAELKSNKDFNLTPDWQEEGYRIYPPSGVWGECTDVTKLIKNTVGTVEYSECVSMVTTWFQNQIQFLNQQRKPL